MILTELDVGHMRGVKLAEFDDANDLSRYIKNAKHTKRNRDLDAKWAGGSMNQFHERCSLGDPSYMDMAEKFVDKFANLALADYDVDLDYNTQVGVLDYQAAMAGEPCCMFGPAHVETEKAPVNIYVDTWTSCTIPTRVMTMRGVAVLALVRALSIYRPVLVKITTGMHHTPTRTDAIVTVDVPTAPMDVSIASWMLGSPQPFRCGFLGSIWELAGSDAMCGIPRLKDASWQARQMGDYLAARDGVNDVVHLPYMMDKGQWDSEEYCLSWVKKQLARFAPQPN